MTDLINQNELLNPSNKNKSIQFYRDHNNETTENLLLCDAIYSILKSNNKFDDVINKIVNNPKFIYKIIKKYDTKDYILLHI